MESASLAEGTEMIDTVVIVRYRALTQQTAD